MHVSRVAVFMAASLAAGSACAISSNTSSSLGGGGLGGGGGGGGDAPANETVSSEDAAIIVPAAEAFMKDCGNCVAPGFDFQARTVKVNASDVAQRDRWIKDVLDPNGGMVHDAYVGALKNCEWKGPQIAVDVAVVKFWQVNTLAPPVSNIFDALWDTCGNPPNPAVKAFVQKIARVHVRVARNWPKGCPSGSCGYEYSFDADTGTLVVGVHNQPVNVTVEAAKWLKQQ